MAKVLISLTLLIVTGCATVGMPQKFDDCYRFEEGFKKDVVTGIGKQISNNQVCIQGPVIEPSSTQQLLNLPYPNQKTVVAVYAFPDLTGQRKGGDNIASFSTAVTQGAEHILVEALRDAGKGNWFVVVERGGLDSLTKERQRWRRLRMRRRRRLRWRRLRPRRRRRPPSRKRRLLQRRKRKTSDGS